MDVAQLWLLLSPRDLLNKRFQEPRVEQLPTTAPFQKAFKIVLQIFERITYM